MKRLDAQGDPIRGSWEDGIIVVITIVAIMFVAFHTFTIVKIDRQILHTATQVDKIEDRYEDLVYENDLLWNYVENIDTFKTLDDAIAARSQVFDLIQFIDE